MWSLDKSNEGCNDLFTDVLAEFQDNNFNFNVSNEESFIENVQKYSYEYCKNEYTNYDDKTLESMASTMTAIVLSRCGFDISNIKFEPVDLDFQSYVQIQKDASICAKDVLLKIEEKSRKKELEHLFDKVIDLKNKNDYNKINKESEEVLDNVRDRIHQSGGLFLSGTGTGATPGRRTESLGKNEGEIPEGRETGDIRGEAISSDISSSSDLYAAQSGRDVRQIDDRDGGERRSGRRTEDEESAGVGRQNEQLQTESYGDSDPGSDRERGLHVNNLNVNEINEAEASFFYANKNEQLSFLNQSEESQRKFIEER